MEKIKHSFKLTNTYKITLLLFLFALIPLAGCTSANESAASQPKEEPGTNQVQEKSSSDSSNETVDAPHLGDTSIDEQFTQLEQEFDARIGVYAIDTGTGQTIAYRADERFAYASTFKALAAGAILQQSSIEELDKVITYKQEDLVTYSPVTELHVNTGMSLRDISEAAVRYSDNTAGNLMFHELGGPEGFQNALEQLGDTITNPVRYETELNEAKPGDERDTSTPRALAGTLEAYIFGDILPEDKRSILIDWMLGNATGDELIRAGAPEGWTVADKSGAGGYGTRNDIAVVWPPDGDPIVMAVLSSRDTQDASYDNSLVAQAAKVTLETFKNNAE
ncbi:class A beta-lactamase [Bacillus horti]|uniref:Beta-lactamase n=1 Tax=Caldalkalibacillus horti TaxID=77523 RepID=A0ABT9VV83_9BACI|nr:class A beta-lactamase [Bacillus horti]MDQ0164901.1 beta-lactamase class A [Bacillus horti]